MPRADEGGTNAFVAVGSNIEPLTNIPAALRFLMGQVEVTGTSTFYRTQPLGRANQPVFVNGVWRISTTLEPHALKYIVLRQLEEALGRVRTEDRYADRTIDLDLVLYGDVVSDEPGLVLPDPDILQRPFLAVALVELEPELAVGGTHLRLADMPVSRMRDGMEPLHELTEALRRMVAR